MALSLVGAGADRFLEWVELAAGAELVHAGLQFDGGMRVVITLVNEQRRLANSQESGE